DKAVKASLLASQIDLTATQINMAAEHVVITGEKNKGQTIIEGGFLKTALIDVERLIAQEAFIKNLVAKKLYIDTDQNTHQDFEAWFDETNGLKIKNNGEEIFKVDRNGNVFAKKATLQDGIFTGEIFSGPLELINRSPDSTSYYFKKNTRVDSYFNEYGTIIAWGKGLYNGESLKHVRLSYSVYPYAKVWEISFSKKGMDLHKCYEKRWDEKEEQWINWRDDRLDEDIMFYTNANTKTFKLKNLPRSEPNEKDVLWVENGFLKIKL
ncbi:MAG: hypothetical protein ACTTKD_10445, partial [Peptoanaerobacter stomatis]|uniref:hypothetical protein n=1 Tax=Peptoanaerobacter stomatis TaxID=796937 RepID=UPI003F9F8AEA